MPPPHLSEKEALKLADRLAVGNFAVGLGAFAVVAFAEGISQDFSVSIADTGLMMGVYAGVYAIASPVMIALTRDMGRRKLLLLALGLFAIGMVITAVAQAWSLALIGRAVSAVGGTIYTPAAAGFVASLSAVEMRGKVLARVFLGLTLSQAIGLPLGFALADLTDWRMAMLAIIGVALAAMIACARTLPRETTHVKGLTLRQALRPGLPAGLQVVVMLIHISAYATVFTFVAPLFGTVHPGAVFAILWALGLGGAAGSLVVGRVTDRLGATRTMIGILASQALILPVLTIAGMPLGLAFVLVFIWPFCAGAVMVPQQVRLIALAPQNSEGVLALNATANYLGVMAGAMIGGRVVHHLGLNAVGPIGGVLALAALVWFLAALRLQKSSLT